MAGENNPNLCSKCVWKAAPNHGWCYWWYTEPTEHCGWEDINPNRR